MARLWISLQKGHENSVIADAYVASVIIVKEI